MDVLLVLYQVRVAGYASSGAKGQVVLSVSKGYLNRKDHRNVRGHTRVKVATGRKILSLYLPLFCFQVERLQLLVVYR